MMPLPYPHQAQPLPYGADGAAIRQLLAGLNAVSYPAENSPEELARLKAEQPTVFDQALRRNYLAPGVRAGHFSYPAPGQAGPMADRGMAAHDMGVRNPGAPAWMNALRALRYGSAL